MFRKCTPPVLMALAFSGVMVPGVANAATPSSCAADASTAATRCCVVSSQWSLSSTNINMPFNKRIYTNGPGPSSNTYTVTTTGTVSASVQVGAESEVGAVLAKAKVSISASLTASNSTSITNSVLLTAPAGKYTHGQYVAWGKRVTYRNYRVNSNCSTSTIASGVIDYPTSSEGWHTWIDSVSV